MSAALTALPTVYLLIALGYVFRRTGTVDLAYWAAAEKLSYFVFMPALLIYSLARVDFMALALGPMALAIFLTLLAMAALILAVRPLLKVSGPTFTSIFQGAARINGIVGLAAAAALFGDTGLAMSAIVMVAFIPASNILTVSVMARYGDGQTAGLGGTLRSMGRNPMILAVGAGMALNFSNLGLPFGTDIALKTLGQAALPIGLLAVGAGLEFGAARRAGRSVLAVSVVKLTLMPALAWLLCDALGVTGQARVLTILFMGLPGSMSSYILARHMGGDAPFSAAAITVSHLLAAASLPLLLFLIGG